MKLNNIIKHNDHHKKLEINMFDYFIKLYELGHNIS